MQTLTIDRSKEWTVEDYLQLEEGLLAQLIDGELIMSPAPSTLHQRTVRNLYDLLRDKVSGELFFSPVDVYLDKRNVVQPDLVFVSEKQAEIVTERGIEGTPQLIIEVISPSNSFIDRNTKRNKYLKAGVVEYWIVDPANKTLEIYAAGDFDKPRLYLAKDGKVNSLISNNIKFDLSEVFANI
jgi:Uma2 family endonuclease